MAPTIPLWKPVVIFSLILLISLFLCSTTPCSGSSKVAAMSSQLMRDALDDQWPSSTPSIYYDSDGGDGDDGIYVGDGTGMSSSDRRSLYWRRHYYISYGALAANRIPCPPRSGRSYYTHNCYSRRGPAHPYVRGCSMITSCRR